MKKIFNETTSTVNPEYGTLPCDGERRINTDYLTQAGNNALAEKIKAMNEEELEIVVDNIPVELCLKRIQKELERNKKLVEVLRGVSIML